MTRPGLFGSVIPAQGIVIKRKRDLRS